MRDPIRVCRNLSKLCALVLWTGWLVVANVADLGAVEPNKSVLMICSYYQGDAWQDKMVAGVQSIFQSNNNLVLAIESLDTRRRPLLSYEPQFVALLLVKYKANPPDLIIVANDGAFDFWLRHRRDIFPDTPVVFCGLIGFTPEMLHGQKNITGIIQAAEWAKTIELALKNHPKTKTFYVTSNDRTEFSLSNMRNFRHQAAQLPSWLDFRELHNLTPDQVPEKIGELPPDSILLNVSALVTNDGSLISQPETSRLLSKSSKIPMYSTFQSSVGEGFVGGYIVTSNFQGRAAAQMALRILAGTPADSIPIIDKDVSTPIFDWRQLQRWGINIKDLPRDSVIINKPYSEYENYRGVIWSTIAALAILTWLVILLWISRTRLVRAEQALRMDEARLAALLRLNQIESASLEKIAQAAIEEAVQLTHSQQGFLGFLNAEQTLLTMFAWSEAARKQCQVVDPPQQFPLSKAGLWGEVIREQRPIIVNSYDAPNPGKKELPAGHVPLTRILHVPILEAGRVIALAGVANKAAPYNEPDMQQLTLLMTGMWQMVQRRQAEEGLRNKTQELDVFFTATLDLLCIADRHGRFRRLNPEWEKALGYRLEELEGRRFLDFVHPEDQKATFDALQQLGQQEVVLNLTNRYRCKDGSYRWIEWRAYPVGQLIYAAARDVTARKQSEEARLEMERRIQHAQKLESLGVLAGGIAHDFNNLLMAILGNIELAQETLAPYSPAQPYVQDAGRAAQRAAELTRQMLAYSGKGRFLIQALDLSTLVEEMAHLLKSSVSKKVELNLRLDEALPPIQADTAQIQQVVMNLIVNASEAIGEQSGTISVATGIRQCDSAYLAFSRLDDKPAPGTFVFLEVSDTGCGMDEQTQRHLFEPFFTTKFTGRGLGMSAVLGIVRGHQGAIMVYSEPGKGTTFKLLFPASAAAEGAAVSATVGKGEKRIASQLTGKVLLVDDEEFVRNVGKSMLERLGLQVLTAADGQQAVEVLREHKDEVGCVLLDLTMPKMDGEATFSALKQVKPDIKVILSSGYNHQDVTRRFAGKGLAGFIQKPYQLANLQQALGQIIQKNG